MQQAIALGVLPFTSVIFNKDGGSNGHSKYGQQCDLARGLEGQHYPEETSTLGKATRNPFTACSRNSRHENSKPIKATRDS